MITVCLDYVFDDKCDNEDHKYWETGICFVIFNKFKAKLHFFNR